MNIIIDADQKNPDGVNIPCFYNFYHHILLALGYDPQKPPIGDLLSKMHGLEGKWLIASPILWQASHNDAMIVASGSALGISHEESQNLFHTFKNFLDGGMEVFFHDRHHWLVRYDNKPEINAAALSSTYHQSMLPLLQMLDKSLFWQSLITESQMLFNQMEKPSLKINGLWFWGNGTISVAKEPLFCTPALHTLGSILSSEVQEISLEPKKYAKNAVFILDHLSTNTLFLLEKQLKRKPAKWYWNNTAYTKTTSWWTRLWRK
ncbi:Uncharacterized protein conserved in bacteria (plasmid) [Legionella adelaidensis]|uniref:Uncharacterized protein conserved in bacteria n=1 Tax=Legionella adelaidensis TaxID=45056 RepID=A0A0W0R4B6_9GAMM|nr:hypothetical protein [Legionella adelaidensis]KTC65924.1 hypothetical protein Lade_0582 [Legionella adelaidensis]VEH85544.1 Uncharacterized protein conserved in bacteria [Legionella adelaidensis]